MRVWPRSSALLLAVTVLGPMVMAADVIIEKAELPKGVDKEDEQYIDNKQKEREKLMQQRREMEEKLAGRVKELQVAREKLAVPGNGSVTIDEETKAVPEPADMEAALGMEAGRRVRDAYEISPDDFNIEEHERWSINTTDFKIDPPQYITAQTRVESDRTWFGFRYTITNTSSKKRRITPIFTAVTNRGVFNMAVGGFIPERIAADSAFQPLGRSERIEDKELLGQGVLPLESSADLGTYAFDQAKGAHQLSPMSTFEAGQTRSGVALWSNFSNEFTELKIVVSGLNNSHRYDQKMRRVLVLSFERNDDEFHVYRSELKYKDKQFQYIWAWDQDITVPLPGAATDPQIKAQTLKTPAGADKLMWAFPFVVKNSTPSKQEIAINTVSFVCPVEVDVGGTKVPVEVKIVDDGTSTIYKAQMLKALGKESPPDRYASKTPIDGSATRLQRRKQEIEGLADKNHPETAKGLDENLAVFDSSDIDWADAKFQIETALTEKLDKKAIAKETWERVAKSVDANDAELQKKNPGYLYDPRRLLTDDEMKQVKEQIEKALPAAVEAAKAKKTVVAWFDCTSGLSTGSYRISRSYRLPGVVDESWLKAWEELEKGQ